MGPLKSIPPPPTDREINEAMVEALTKVLQALRSSDSRRGESERKRDAQFSAFMAEIREVMIALLSNDDAQRTQAVEKLKAASREPSGLHLAIGDGSEENTTRVQLGQGHWNKVWPWLVRIAVTIAGAAGWAKYLGGK